MHLLVLTGAQGGAKAVLPALEFLDHALASAPLSPDVVDAAPEADLLLIDATGDLASASHTCRAAAASERSRPVVLVIGEGGLAALKGTWGFDDWVLPGAQPAEVETRLRLAVDRARSALRGAAASVGDLTIDETTYVVRVKGQPLDLTFREFELLKHLAAHPGQVFTRSQLLQEVWGYDYFGGTRTVDVHIRRLRAKMGPEHEHLIGTIRGVGYKLDPHSAPAQPTPEEDDGR